MSQQTARHSSASFDFIAIGDTPYGASDGDTPAPEHLAQFDRLIAHVNTLRPAFTVHVGDIKAAKIKSADGTQKTPIPCTECYYAIIRGRFDRFQHPFIYTPGDNETIDCTGKPGLTAAQALKAVRRIFFADACTRPQAKALDLVSQSEAGKHEHREFRENLRWWQGGLLFVTVNVVGANDNRPDGKSGDKREHKRRSAAARAWLRQAFKLAERGGAPGLVVMMQADPFRRPGHKGSGSGFAKLMDALEAHLKHFRRPLLLVHGDGHCFCTDLPQDIPVPRVFRRWLTRVQVFGENAVHAVRVHVDPAAEGAAMFSIAPEPVPGNPRYEAKSYCPQYKGKYRRMCGYGG